jgi:hypothetical protein
MRVSSDTRGSSGGCAIDRVGAGSRCAGDMLNHGARARRPSSLPA